MKNFIMTLSCNTIVDTKDHVQYLTVFKSSSENCTFSLTEQNIAINDHNDTIYRALYAYTNIQQNTFIKLGLDFVKKVYFF